MRIFQKDEKNRVRGNKKKIHFLGAVPSLGRVFSGRKQLFGPKWTSVHGPLGGGSTAAPNDPVVGVPSDRYIFFFSILEGEE